ncbi:retinoblastoma family protein-like [Anopheles maculipalpis]|uniref:retinoblastoma family protein-like n=1 Tax=Anopheles maculipalpis TaxID=1496333 RepID=UPI002158F50A|nr:retinoblastoma family protein-like [Anopheles maculipalpis]
MSSKEETVPNPLDGERETHREICRALNIDADTEKQSWCSYERARSQYDLTVNPKHWMCCSLYVACLQELPAVGHPNHLIQGNGVNITNLLSQCSINIQQFFDNVSQWAEIRSLPTHLQLEVEKLKHAFSVAYRTYSVYREVFPRIFNEANIVPDEPKRNKKSKPNPCSYNKLREFGWLLFLTVKEQHNEHRHDLTTAIDLCVCVIDLIYRNVVAEDRMDLVNPNVLSEAGTTIDGTTEAAEAAKRINIPELLCVDCPTMVESVEETNLNIFLPSLSVMHDGRDLLAKRVTTDTGATTYMGLVSVPNFEENLKLFNRRYERSILRCGMLDERIALNSRSSPTSQQRNRWCAHPYTPLSIKAAQSGAASSVNRVGFAADLSTNGGAFVVRGTHTQLLKKIQGHIPGHPRESFLALMQNCTPSPLPTVLEHVVRMRQRFVSKLTENEGWNGRSAESRFVAIEALYYQLLENIIPWELKKRPLMPVSKAIFDLCSNSIFNETLIVCGAEVIFFLRQEQHNFPWILEVFGMEPFQFFNIIEVTVSSNSDIFTSDIVNHLRRIEEQLVDSISWKSSSVLWECMEKENYQIPENKDVEQRAAIAGVTPLKADSMPNTPNGTRGGSSSGVAGSSGAGPSVASTVPSTTGRPVPHPDSAKKKLFVDPPATPSKVAPASSMSTTMAVAAAGSASAASSASSSEMANAPGHGTSNDSQSISSFSSPQRCANDNNPPSIETRRLNFFFRKMYQVAYERLCNLCQNLGIVSEEIQKLIWTILEFTITKCSKELMRDRHLDQLLMCAVFVTIRIKRLSNTFMQIMRCYHSQPQANSSIYRSVFIRYENGTPPSEENGGANGGEQQQEQAGETERLPVTEMSGTSVQYDREVYGDIIKFYNDIYVRTVHQLAFQYYNTDISQASLFLSPTPKSQVRNIQKSPRQISSGINLFVSTTSKIESLKDSPNVRVITFPSSPGQSPTIHDRKVPVLVREKPGDTVVRKLIEPAAFEPTLPSKLRRLDKIHQERQHQDHESSENE